VSRSFFASFAILAMALSMTFAADTDAEEKNPLGGAENSVAAWGSNQYGQLGDGTGTDHSTPQLLNLSGVAAVAAGAYHSLAVKSDGTVWAWGQGASGQLGIAGLPPDQRYTPVQVLNLSGVAAVAAGAYHSLAVKSDGTVWAWGANAAGQLGVGTTTLSHFPLLVQNLSGVAAVAGGAWHSLALKSDGTVWAWGLNNSGQLGDGTTIERHTPVQVENLSGVAAVAAGGGDDWVPAFSLALKSDGTLWAWGDNAFGQLGDGTTIERHTPVQVRMPPLSHVTAVAAGIDHSLALKDDGTVWAWGSNQYGQLGDGTGTDHSTPQLLNLSGVAAIAARLVHSLAVKSDGTVWAWGGNFYGELGDGTNAGHSTPVLVQNHLSGATVAVGGEYHSLALGPLTQLTVFKILTHPDDNYLRLFNLQIDGITVRANVNCQSPVPTACEGGTVLVSPGPHTVSETGGTGTSLSAFSTVIGGDCAASGAVDLALNDHKTCSITNYDHFGGCLARQRSVCCEPGDGTSACLKCSPPFGECP
jgi:alpha-tubulin suppressor-like RCC1 family protein